MSGTSGLPPVVASGDILAAYDEPVAPSRSSRSTSTRRPAGQKVDGFRFLRQFPALRDRLGGDNLRKVVFEEVAEGAG